MSRPSNLMTGRTVYWTLMIYDDQGVLVDPDITPTVSVTRNGTPLADLVSVIKRGPRAGTYDCQYNPSTDTEGDFFGLEEIVTVAGQAYVNPWSLEVVAPERGTDNANTVTPNTVTPNTIAPDNSSISQVLGVVSELQGNQGQWLTATGFSTFDPTTDTVNSVGTVAVCASNSDMRGTDNANTVAPDNAGIAENATKIDQTRAAVDVVYGIADDILDDTSNLNANQGQWLTATGFSTFNPVTTTVITDTASRNASKADVSGLSTFNASTDQVVASNMRGTDNVNTSDLALQATLQNVGTNVGDTLIAALNLQANQNNWLTATETVATNMRGTDDALLASTAPNHFDIMAINASGAITTSNPSTGGTGSDHTAEDVAALILAVPTSPIGNTSSGSISLVDTTTNLTNSGAASPAPTTAEMYNYFTSGSRQVTFRSDVSGLATESNMLALNSGLVSLIDGLNDFDPSSDVVQNVNSVVTTTNLTNGSDSTLAKQNEIIASIASLNDFNPSSDVVASVTLVNTTTNLTNGGSSGGGGGDATAANQQQIISDIAALNDFNPSTDAVANVVLVNTTTNLTNQSGGSNGGGGTTIVSANPTPRAF
jgi:hypothetical protein